jgi:hypothetical protein
LTPVLPPQALAKDIMKLSVVLAVVLAASADAAVLERRQRDHPDGM